MPAISKSGNVQCHQCGSDYKRIGTHWVQSSSCDHPPLTQLQKDVLVGLLMGDGGVGSKKGRNQNISVSWISEKQCEWLDDVLGWLSTGVTFDKTAEEVAKATEESGINGDGYEADADDFNDQYRVRTRSHPFITGLTNWYGEDGYGDKCWPDDIHLSPTVLLLWFVGDGCYNDGKGSRRINIGLSNESENEEKVASYFTRVNIPAPSRWNICGHRCSACWNVTESKSLFEYMNQSPLMSGDVPDGFEYKFPIEYGGCGKRMDDLNPQ